MQSVFFIVFHEKGINVKEDELYVGKRQIKGLQCSKFRKGD
jgi:hypothetical protein